MESDQKNEGQDDGQQDKWADLLSGLGIEPTEEQALPEAPPQDVSPSLPQPPVDHSTPSRPAAGWNDLASDFGLEVSAPEPKAEREPESVSEPEPPVAATVEDAPTDATIEPVQAESPEPQALEEQSTGEPTPPEAAIDVGTDTRADEPAAIQADGKDDPVPAEEPTAPAGFGATGLTLPDWFPFGGRKKAKQAEEAKDEPANDESASVLDDAEPSPGLDDTAVFVRPPLDAAATETDNLASDETTDSDDASSEDRPKRSRRRRGRRRGRGRGRGREASENEAETTTSDTIDEESEEMGSADVQDDSPDDESSSQAGEKKVRSISHKNIPAWQEAIGVVVDANIAARGERKRSNSRGRGGSRGGRGRGRRRSKDSGTS